MTFRFVTTADHAPEPGLGGSEYEVWTRWDPVAGAKRLGIVRSSWNRSNGVHWTAMTPGGRGLTYSTNPNVLEAFPTRVRAAEALQRAAA